MVASFHFYHGIVKKIVTNYGNLEVYSFSEKIIRIKVTGVTAGCPTVALKVTLKVI